MTSRPLIIGEVLVDHFPGGQRVLGGAPFNVAWNLQGLGLSPTLISAVGSDPEGAEIRARMEAWGLDTSGLQTRSDFPTGQVQVTLDKGQPSYKILSNQAYDHIRMPAPDASLADFGLLYMGSLALRSAPTRSTIEHVAASSGLPRFVDINIRQPHFDRSWLPTLLGGAQWVKINDEELGWVTGRTCRDGGDIRAAAEELRKSFGPACYWITAGAAGAYALDQAGAFSFAHAPPPDPLIDTVGAGDAFAAATIAGILRDQPVAHSLDVAVRFASRICSLRGATSTDRSRYIIDDLTKPRSRVKQ